MQLSALPHFSCTLSNVIRFSASIPTKQQDLFSSLACGKVSYVEISKVFKYGGTTGFIGTPEENSMYTANADAEDNVY